MPTLHQLLKAIRHTGDRSETLPDCIVTSVTSDSRKVRPGSIFVALQGDKQDGHAFVAQAVQGGCCAIVVEKGVAGVGATPLIRVDDTHRAYGELAAEFFGNPARELRLIGLTGTNGKTTTSWIIEEMLQSEGKNVGVIGTVNYRYADRQGRPVVREATLTTPEPMEFQGLLREMRGEGVTHLVMEVSSHALVQQRIAGVRFDVAVFTNLSRDHLDFHRTMEEYFAAKQLLFTRLLQPNGVAVVVTGADPEPAEDWGGKLLATLKAKGFVAHASGRKVPFVISCGTGTDCLVRAENCAHDLQGFQADVYIGGKPFPLHSRLIGDHNVRNMLAAAGVGLALGLRPDRIICGLQKITRVPGRLEDVLLPSADREGKVPRVFVDYAHTPDALANVLRTLRQVTPGRLYCIVGCGGDRDRGKRPMMGKVAAELADRVVITSDNPRSENPESIISEIETGVRDMGVAPVPIGDLFVGRPLPRRYCVLPDRRQAIHTVCALVNADDVVLIAGKGHETYQITAAGKHFFDDRLEAKNSALRWTRERLLRASGGRLVQQGDFLMFNEISTDTRTIRPGDVFLALRGENFDGHDFVGAALASGASCLIVERPPSDLADDVCVIQVADTLRAYQDLASFRRRLLSSQLRVVAVTGSSGKTTVKEISAAIFNLQYGVGPTESVLKTQGNLNNLVGLPRTLLQAHAGHRAAVLEMGMNRPGEIQRLTETADPDIGCITNVQAAHLEGLGSIEGVAQAKGELFAAMRDEGIRVVNCDDARIRGLARRFGGWVVGFGVTEAGRRYHPEVRATRIVSLGEAGMRFTLHIGDWRQRLTVPATGAHNVSNCAAAAAIATAAGIPPELIARGLACYSSGDKRLQIVPLPGGISVLNDSYNANPGSMAAALRTIHTFGASCRRIAALGDMLELGGSAAEAHRQVGALVAELGLDYLAVTGEHAGQVAKAAITGGMPRRRVKVCADTGEVARWLAELIQQHEITRGDWVLLKGSRGMRMEQVLKTLQELLTTQAD